MLAGRAGQLTVGGLTLVLLLSVSLAINHFLLQRHGPMRPLSCLLTNPKRIRQVAAGVRDTGGIVSRKTAFLIVQASGRGSPARQALAGTEP